MTPGDAGVALPVREARARDGHASRQEAVEPAVVPLAVPAQPPRVVVALARAAPPVERRLEVHVVVDREVVAEILDLSPVARRVAHDVAEAEPRREHAAAAPAPRVLVDERQPEHGDVGDVEHGRPRDDVAVADDLHFLGGEVIVRLGELARRDVAAVPVEHLAVARRVGADRGAVRLHVPGLCVLFRGADDVLAHAAPGAHVVPQPAEGDEIRFLLRRIAEHDGVAGGQDDVGRVVIDDAVAHQGGRFALHGGAADEKNALGLGLELHPVTLVACRDVAGTLEERVHERVGFAPLHELALRARGVAPTGVGGGRVAPEEERASRRRVGTLRVRERRREAEGEQDDQRRSPHAVTSPASAASDARRRSRRR